MYFSRYAAQGAPCWSAGSTSQQSMSHYLIEQIEAIDNIDVRTCTEVVGGARRRAPRALDPARPRRRRTRRRSTPQSLFVFIGAAPRTDWLDGVLARDEHGFVLTGPDLIVDGRAPARLGPRPRPLPPGVQRPGRVRRRRRPRRLGQTGRLRRRRGRHGRHPGPPLPLEQQMSMPHRRPRTSCATLFLFEALTDEQLDWLAGSGDVVESTPPAPTSFAEGEPRDLLLRPARRAPSR